MNEHRWLVEVFEEILVYAETHSLIRVAEAVSVAKQATIPDESNVMIAKSNIVVFPRGLRRIDGVLEMKL